MACYGYLGPAEIKGLLYMLLTLVIKFAPDYVPAVATLVEEPRFTNVARLANVGAFSIVLVVMFLVFLRVLCKSEQDEIAINVPPRFPWQGSTGKKDRSTVQAYDLSQLRGRVQGVLFSCAMVQVLSVKAEYTLPLLITAIDCLYGLPSDKLVRIHCFCADATRKGLRRPWSRFTGIWGVVRDVKKELKDMQAEIKGNDGNRKSAKARRNLNRLRVNRR